ncbi:biotin transporter BioY [Pseudogracilibacillus auburnensis]|uniref:Biotin transporter n=1 Tax=Pseudogracilibacillus auburnensis TaxID=1494959 RepID=A0A2V3VZA0_9BACI|nr:biotin transporter BioY [Pseudogracilibacillus auburnensis]PXW86950.1 biotin transport system substrate-specific component [Pseudogracilibacillus auburnensis]
MNHSKLQMMIVTALFAAIIGILAQVTIPLPLVPITGQTLAIGLAATILGSRYGTLSSILYLIIGAIGVPVFAQMTSGLGVIFGPTGGFLIGFIPTTFIIGLYLEKTSFTVINAFIANVIGMFITLTFGTFWLKFVAGLTWTAAFLGGFAPFIIVGIIKAFLAGWIGVLVRNRLQSANILYTATK